MIDEIECSRCEGMGEWDEGPLPAHSAAEEPEYRQVICPDCGGKGWRAPTDDELAEMAEAQAEDAASGEPPVSVQEMYEAAYRLKQELRR
jgi:hypothetical protein